MNNYELIKQRVTLGLPLTEQERAIYLLFIATTKEATEFLKGEQNR